MWVLFVLLVLVLLLVFPRRMLPILIGALLVVGATGGWHYWQLQETARQQGAVTIAVTYDPAECPVALPLRVTIRNESPLTVARVEWAFSARRAGYRGELTGGWLADFAMEDPLPAGDQFSACYPAPGRGEYAVQRESDQLENLVLGIRHKNVIFSP